MNGKRLLILVAVGVPILLLTAVLLIAALSQARTPQSAEVLVTATDFKFSPFRVTVKQGQVVVLTFKNEGKVMHALDVKDELGKVLRTSDGADTEVAVKAEPGAIDTIRFTAPARGEYKMLCPIKDHAAAGMGGVLVVE